MRILFIDFDLPYLVSDSPRTSGGWATELDSWIAGLTQTGHDCGVLTWKGARKFAGGNYAADLIDTYDPSSGLRVLKYFYRYIPALLAAARRFAPDVIVQSTAGVQTGMMAFVAKRLGVPFVHRIANDVDADGRYSKRLKSYERLAYRYGLKRSALILCQNEYQRRQLQKSHPGARLAVIHNPLKSPEQRKELLPREKRKYTAWLGVFRAQKNMALLYRIASAHPDIAFKIGGAPTDGQSPDEDTRDAISKLELLPNVTFAGYVQRSQVGEFLSGAVALLCTSHHEGFSNAFLEAFAAGTPVLTREGVDPDDIIARHVLGRVAGCEEDLSASVAQTWRMDANTFCALSAHCRAYALEHHDPAAKAKEFVRVLAPLMK